MQNQDKEIGSDKHSYFDDKRNADLRNEKTNNILLEMRFSIFSNWIRIDFNNLST